MTASARITRSWDGPQLTSSAPSGETGSRGRGLLPDMTGRLVGQYRLVRRIGEGGMGAVYEALHQQIGRRVAIKILSSDLARDPEIIDRFFNEARAVNIIQHPDIVNISELGQLGDGTAYLVMEYLAGESLSQRLRRVGQLSVAEALRIVRQVALALRATHDKGIVHRDLKPDNIIVIADAESPGGERAKLLDFGIAKLAEEHQAQGLRPVRTRAGMVLGTPIYMSPEQCRGAAHVDSKADVYSLGVLLYEMLAGRPPFTAEGEGELVAAHIYEEPPPVSELVAGVPAALAALVGRMLDKDRTLRPTMAEVVTELEAAGAPGRSSPELLPVRSSPELPPVRSTPELPPVRSTPELPPAAASSGSRLSPVIVTSHGSQRVRRRPPQALLGTVALALLVGVGLVGAALLSRRPQAQGVAPRVVEWRRVRWSVVTTPPGAAVIRSADGALLGTTPYEVERSATSGSVAVLLRRAGYQDKRLELDLSANVQVREVLLLEAAAVAPPPPERELRRPPRGRGHLRPSVRAGDGALVPPAAPTPGTPGVRGADPPSDEAPPEVQDFEEALKARKERAGNAR